MRKIAAIVVVGVALSGCSHWPYGYQGTQHDRITHGALVGAGVGGIAGAVATGTVQGAAVGAGIGALVGGAIGARTYGPQPVY
jgi:hypothetical protein